MIYRKISLFLVVCFVCHRYRTLAFNEYFPLSDVADAEGHKNPLLLCGARPFQQKYQQSIPINRALQTNNAKLYLYKDSTDGRTAVGLNITWNLKQQFTSSNLPHGYRLSFYTENFFTNIYCRLNQSFERANNVPVMFYYDNFGRSDHFSVTPGQRYMIVITRCQNEEYQEESRVGLDVPGCREPTMKQVQECKIQQQVKVAVDGSSCSDRTKKLIYNVPKEYGNFAFVLLCKPPSPKSDFCSKGISFLKNIPLNGTLQVKLPEKYSLEDSYSIQVWGNFQRIRYMAPINFENCEKNTNNMSSWMLGLVILIPVLVLLLVGMYVSHSLYHWFKSNHCSPEYHSFGDNLDLV